MMEGWTEKIWDEVLEIRSGRNQKEVEDPKGKFPIIGSAGKIMGYANDYICEEGTTIVGRKGTINNPMLIEDKFWNVDTAFGLHAKDSLDKRFLHYFCLSFDFTEMDRGSGRPSLVKSDLLKIKMLVPPLTEQQRIVSILDEAFAAIDKAKANAQQNLKNAKELFESYLQGVFKKKGDGWEEKKLGEVFDIGSSKRIMEKDWTADGVPFYGGKEIVKLSKFGYAESNSFISEDKYNEYASKYDMPAHGDILITARGTIGIGYIVKMGDKFYYKDGNIISMRAKMPTNPEFILYALKSNAIHNQLRKLTGATVSHLPINKAKKLVLMMPNFSTQNIVVENIKEIEVETQKLEAVYQKKMDDLEELKKSILQKAFAGELETEKAVTV